MRTRSLSTSISPARPGPNGRNCARDRSVRAWFGRSKGWNRLAAKSAMKQFLGELALTAEFDWMLRQKNRSRRDHYNLDRLEKSLPAASAVAASFARNAPAAHLDLFFATLD